MADQDKFDELDPTKIIEEMREEYWRGLSEVEKETEEKVVQVLVVELAGELYALDAVVCRHIVKKGHITRMPRMPDYMLGVINLRGQIIPVVDLAGLFGLKRETIAGGKERLVVVETGGLRTAFLVQRVLGIETVEMSRIQEPESTTSPIKDEYIKGHVAPAGDEEWITYLDIEKTVLGPELDFSEK